MNSYQMMEQLVEVLRKDLSDKSGNITYSIALLDAITALVNLKKFY